CRHPRLPWTRRDHSSRRSGGDRTPMTPNFTEGETLLRDRSATKEPDLAATMAEIGRRARTAAAALALASAQSKVGALCEGARAVRDRAAEILAANARDLAAAEDL